MQKCFVDSPLYCTVLKTAFNLCTNTVKLNARNWHIEQLSFYAVCQHAPVLRHCAQQFKNIASSTVVRQYFGNIHKINYMPNY